MAERDPRLLHGRVRCKRSAAFRQGITKESYPCVFGNSPVPNLIAGWFSFTIAEPSSATSPISSLAPFQLAGAVDALGIALFHAAIGAFGRQPIRLAVTGHGGPP